MAGHIGFICDVIKVLIAFNCDINKFFCEIKAFKR